MSYLDDCRPRSGQTGVERSFGNDAAAFGIKGCERPEAARWSQLSRSEMLGTTGTPIPARRKSSAPEDMTLAALRTADAVDAA